MCRTYIVYTCTSPLPSPFSPFLHKVLLSAWCGELPDKKTPSLVQKVWEEMKNLCWLWMLNQSHQVCRRRHHHQCPFSINAIWKQCLQHKCGDSVVFCLVIRVSPPPPVLCLHLSILSSSPPPLCEIRLAHLSSNYQRFMFKLILRGGLLLSSSIIML